MNSTIYATATQQGAVRGVDDGVHTHFSDVVTDYFKRHVIHLALMNSNKPLIICIISAQNIHYIHFSLNSSIYDYIREA